MDSNTFVCPFCGITFAITSSTKSLARCGFSYLKGIDERIQPDTVDIAFFKCPTCKEISIKVFGKGSYFEGRVFNIRPTSNAIILPLYVPEKIRQDYEEACAILTLSPKSSATLSRRCLQAMIGDFWGIHKNRLVDSINELKEKVPADQWRVVDAIRKIGNIGAHPEADINTIIEIEPQDAEKLIKVIEFLIKQWYVERFEREKLFNNVLALSDDKENQRKNKA